MQYELVYHDDVYIDLDKLPQKIAQEVFGCFNILRVNPISISLPLQNRKKILLARCRKTYVANKQYRIVFRIEKQAVKVIRVLAVGKRDKKEVYFLAHSRLNQ